MLKKDATTENTYISCLVLLLKGLGMPARLGFSVRDVLSSPEIEQLIVENSDLQIGIHISHLVKN